MSKVFIVGASPLQIPLIQRAKAKNHWVLVADQDPQAVGIPLADAFVEVSTIDEKGIVKAAQDYNVEAIVTTATDQPIRAIARACAACGLPGISEETALNATRKDLMRKALVRGGVPCPVSIPVQNKFELNDAWEKLPTPVILKPVDSSGSRGVSLVREPQSLVDALDYALKHSKSGIAVVEQVLKGREFSVETLAIQGELYVLQITEKETSGPPHFVEAGHSQPAHLTDREKDAIIEISKAAARALGIQTGPTHTEVMLTVEGPQIVEVGARMGGDYITSDLVPLSTGIDMISLVLDLSLGLDVRIPVSCQNGAAIRYFYPTPGKVIAIKGIDECLSMEGVVRIEIFRSVGQTIVPVTGSHERAGYVITQSQSVKDAIRIAEECRQRIQFIVE